MNEASNRGLLTRGWDRCPRDSTEAREADHAFAGGTIEFAHPTGRRAVQVPQLAEPLGYQITPQAVRELDPAARPTCV